MKFPTLSDDLAKILPVKIVLTDDVKAEYSTKQRSEYYKKTGQSSPSSFSTLNFTIPKGTELTLVDNNKYAPDLFYSDKTEKGYPIDIRFKDLSGKANVLSETKKEQNQKLKSNITMKEKMKPMLIGGGIGVAAAVGTAFLMGKKDTKNLILFGVIGLAAGVAVGYFMGGKKEEVKSNLVDPQSGGGRPYTKSYPKPSK